MNRKALRGPSSLKLAVNPRNLAILISGTIAIGLSAVLSWRISQSLNAGLLGAFATILALGAIGLVLVQSRRSERRINNQLRRIGSEIGHIARTTGGSAPVIRRLEERVDRLQTAAVSVSRVGRAVGQAPATQSYLSRSTLPSHSLAPRSNGIVQVQRADGDRLPINAALDADTLLEVPVGGVQLSVPCQGRLDLRLSLDILTESSNLPKAALLTVEFQDDAGNSISPLPGLALSERYGPYVYLAVKDGMLTIPPIEVPPGALLFSGRLVPWDLRPITIRNELARSGQIVDQLALTSRRITAVKVAMICDEFTYRSISPDVDAIPLSPNGWRSELEAKRPDVFFCESAWSGIDSTSRPWKGKVYASDRIQDENRAELLKILTYCRERGIPTVFWNKEDPTHFDDRRHDFVRTALAFDHIFTTDSSCVERYRQEYGHPSVHDLPFAVQPKVFNPTVTGSRADKVVFAGSWYENHRARSQSMRDAFESVLAAGLDLEIIDRYFGDDDPLHQFPEEYGSYIKPQVPYEETAALYRGATYGLTINTEVVSQTMFARRAFELAACNTVILSNYSAGLDAVMGSGVVFIDREGGRLPLGQQEMDDMREQSLDLVLRSHTYRNRLAKVLEIAGVPFDQSPQRVCIAYVIASIDEGWLAVEQARGLANAATGLTVALLVSSQVPAIEVQNYYQAFARAVDAVVSQALFLSNESIRSSPAFGEWIYVADLEVTPSRETIERLLLHSQYVDHPVREERTAQYSYSMSGSLKGSLISADRHSHLLAHSDSGYRGRVFNV